MRRFVATVFAALAGAALLPALAQAQVIVQSPAYVVPSVYVQPTTSYYVAPSISTYSAYTPSYSYYYPSTTAVYAAPTVTYAAPVVSTYAAPAAVVYPSPGYYDVRTSYGYGVFRPRGYSTQVYYHR
jgi:hypothetical protein